MKSESMGPATMLTAVMVAAASATFHSTGSILVEQLEKLQARRDSVQDAPLFGGAEMGTWERTLGCFFRKKAEVAGAVVAAGLASLNCTDAINWAKADPSLLAQLEPV